MPHTRMCSLLDLKHWANGKAQAAQLLLCSLTIACRPACLSVLVK